MFTTLMVAFNNTSRTSVLSCTRSNSKLLGKFGWNYEFLLVSTTGDECRIIIFEEPLPNKAINGHVIRSEEVTNEGSCRMMCYMEPNCVSVNLRPVHGGKYKCELNNATVDESKLTFLEDLGAYYLAIEVMFNDWIIEEGILSCSL